MANATAAKNPILLVGCDGAVVKASNDIPESHNPTTPNEAIPIILIKDIISENVPIMRLPEMLIPNANNKRPTPKTGISQLSFSTSNSCIV